MGRGSIIADNWIADGVAGFDGASTTPSTNTTANLIDYESGVSVVYDSVAYAAGQVDIVIDFGVAVNPNTCCVLKHNLYHGATFRGIIVVSSADDAAQTVNAENLGAADLDNVLQTAAPYNSYINLTEHTGGAKRYWRIRITDGHRQPLNEDIKIGQIVIGSDAMIEPLDRTVYTAIGFPINYDQEYTADITPSTVSNTTLGGVEHSYNITDGRWKFAGLMWSAINGAALTKILNGIAGRGQDRVTRHNAQEPLIPAVNVPVVWIPETENTLDCYYVMITQRSFPFKYRPDPETFDLGPFEFIEQGHG